LFLVYYSSSKIKINCIESEAIQSYGHCSASKIYSRCAKIEIEARAFDSVSLEFYAGIIIGKKFMDATTGLFRASFSILGNS
jgi:hypothetical protein